MRFVSFPLTKATNFLAAVSFLSDHTFNPRLEEGRMAVRVKDYSSKL